MSLTRDVTKMIEKGAVDPDAPRTVGEYEINDALLAAVANAAIRIAQEVDQLTERVDMLRARAGSG
jgi:hypothetical protein